MPEFVEPRAWAGSRLGVKVVNDIRLGWFAAVAVGIGAMSLHACQLQAAFDAEGSLDAGVVLEDARQAQPEDAAKAGAAAAPPADLPAGGTLREVTVRPQDTLWSIAAAALPPNYANVQQYMLAILQENPQAFANGNINGLIAGSRLRLPRGDVETLPDAAIQEVVGQNSAWRGGDDAELKILVREDNWAPRGQDGQPAVVAQPEAAAETAPAELPDGREADFKGLETASPALAASPSEALGGTHRQETAAQDAQLPRPETDLARRDDDLSQRDDEIAELKEEMASLRATMQAERRDRREERNDWRRQLAGWRVAAVVGAAVAAALLFVVLAMRRRRRAATARATQTASPPPSLEPASPQPDDHHFGEPISDHRVKLNLAQANLDLGKLEVAREILEEVRAEGGDAERQEAEALLGRLGPAQS